MCLLILIVSCVSYVFFFFNDTATTEIYTLSLHDALPISLQMLARGGQVLAEALGLQLLGHRVGEAEKEAWVHGRSEEHTSELQSRQYLVCRLLLEKKKRQRRLHSG